MAESDWMWCLDFPKEASALLDERWKRIAELEEALREITYISSDGHIYVGVREDIPIDEYAVIRSLHEKPVSPSA